MRTRLLAAAVLACAAAVALPAHAAAPKPQITDPAGDNRVPNAGLDIVSATFSTSGTTAKVRGKQVYTPTRLVVSVAYAGAVATDPYATHQVTFRSPACGEVYLELYAGGPYGDAECVSGGFDFAAVAQGNVLTFTVPFSAIGKQYFKTGAALTDLVVYTAVGDPLLGYESNELAGVPAANGAPLPLDGTVDTATGTAPFKIG